MIKFGAKKEETVGLDIGSYAIKVCSLTKNNSQNTLTAYNIKKIPQENKDFKIKTLLEEVFDEIDLHPEQVNLSVSGPDVIVRFIDFPRMSKEDLRNALAFEAEKYIPFTVSEVFLDFMILGEAAEADKMRVLLAAVKREPVETLVKTMEEMEIGVNLIDVDPFAVFNAFNFSNPSEEGKCRTFLNLGHLKNDILISVGDMPHFTRQIQIGGKDITREISKVLAVSPEKAEEMKLSPPAEQAEQVKQAVTTILDKIITEVQLSFSYFENRSSVKVGEIYCSGGMVYLDKTVDYLSEKLGSEVKKWNPLAGLTVAENISKQDIDSVASQLAVCIGLALRD